MKTFKLLSCLVAIALLDAAILDTGNDALAQFLPDQEQFADFSISANPVRPGDIVTFDASLSDLPGDTVTYSWDFGDGQGGYGILIDHSYDKVSEYVVTLTVQDELENEDTRQILVSVMDTLTYVRWDQYLTMRDGVKISTALDLPPVAPPSSGWPLVIVGHGDCGSPWFGNPDNARGRPEPYWRVAGIDAIKRGYAIFRPLARGCHDSGGDFVGGRIEAADLIEAITWLIQNAPINPARIGFFGGSHGGLWGLNLLVMEDRLRAAVIANATTNLGEGLASDGSFKYAFGRDFLPMAFLGSWADRSNWRLGISLMTGVERDLALEYLHRRHDTDWLLGRVDEAVFLKLNWTDMNFRANEFLKAFQDLQAQGSPVWLYGGYNGHNEMTSGVEEFPEEIDLIGDMTVLFLDYWLKDIDTTNVMEKPPVVYAIYGTRDLEEGTFQHGYADTWPPPDTQYFTLYLREGGELSPEPPEGTEIPTHIFNDVTQDLPNTVLKAPLILENFDNIEDDSLLIYVQKLFLDVGEFTEDVPLCRVCFTSPPLLEDFEMTGIPSATYFVNSNGEEFLLATEVLDVDSIGHEILITQGPFGKKLEEDEIGETIEVSYDLYGFSYLFSQGHRIKVCISNKASPEALLWGKGLGIQEIIPWGSRPYFLAYFTASETLLLHDSDHPAGLVFPCIGEPPPFGASP